jgi:hypothetical protein
MRRWHSGGNWSGDTRWLSNAARAEDPGHHTLAVAAGADCLPAGTVDNSAAWALDPAVSTPADRAVGSFMIQIPSGLDP